MSDYIIRAIGGQKQVRLFVAVTNTLVEEARKIHQTSPVATAAFGRTLTAAAIMGCMMKGEKDTLTLQFKGDGPLGGILVTADSEANVKGYVNNPMVDIPLKSTGKLDVSGAIGHGTLNIIKDIGMKEPYNGKVELVSGEIAEDLTYYFASSEQTPSVVSLGVLIATDYSVKQSGGFVVQLLPDADEEVIGQLEENIKNIPSMTAMLEDHMDGEAILNRIMKGLDVSIYENERIEPRYRCDCSKNRVERVLITVGAEEIEDMIDSNEPVDMSCHFCKTHYKFEIGELRDILKAIK